MNGYLKNPHAKEERWSQRTHTGIIESSTATKAKPRNTKVAWSLGELEGRQEVLTVSILSCSCSHAEPLSLLVWYDSVVGSASIGVRIPQSRGRSCPYSLLLYCDFVLPFSLSLEREKEEEGRRGGLGLCLHLKNFCHEATGIPGCTLISLSHWNWLPSLVGPSRSLLFIFLYCIYMPLFCCKDWNTCDGYIWVQHLFSNFRWHLFQKKRWHRKNYSFTHNPMGYWKVTAPF